ncbi:MAG: hypothetical protein EOO24_26125 [Comamonadaceae bacterium]|nr:MAG: hypothetical protein EOO24_26125 [Comamonadaceae bacterium]
MDFTKSFVKSKNPCADGFRWYLRHHREGSDYQQVLDALVAEGRVGDACWLLDKVGPANTVLELDHLECDALVFAGSIVVRGSVEVGGTLRVGGGIHCDGPVRCGATLVADWHSDVGGSLAAGALKVMGDLRCGGPLAVAGAVSVRGDLQVAGDCGAGSLAVRGVLDAGGAVRSTQGLVCGSGLACGGHVDAGWGIKCGADVVAAAAIRAGESIEAGGEIQAGPGYGVFAGLCVQAQDWDTSARVTAATRPARLMSGFWTGGADNGNRLPASTATERHHAH